MEGGAPVRLLDLNYDVLAAGLSVTAVFRDKTSRCHVC